MKHQIRFFLKEPTADKSTPINLHFNAEGLRFKMGTGQVIHPEHWDKAKERSTRKAPHFTTINDSLSKLESEVMTAYMKLKNKNDVSPTAEQLKAALRKDTTAGKAKGFFDYWDEWSDERRKVLRPKTLRNDAGVKKCLEEFCKEYGVKLTFDRIDQIHGQRFIDYLLDIREVENGTIWAYLKSIRTFMAWAEERGYHSNGGYRKWNVPLRQSQPVALTVEELDAIRKVDLSENRKLSETRDCFLVQCGTGLRVSDLKAIRSEHITGNTLRLTTTKTDQHIVIPLLPEVSSILERWEYKMPVPDLHDYNERLRAIAGKAKLNRSVSQSVYKGAIREDVVESIAEIISSHTARKTFITLALSKGMRAELVMRLSGHKTMQAFQKYIAVTDEMAADELRRVFATKEDNHE